ncbi:hypothetical protein M2263_000192 [Providencia alcalifaciens]|nr:hypothetical protein [Providencia alcalifaciens]
MYTVGDPAWEESETKGYLGDSEIVISGGGSEISRQFIKAYGQNTIIQITNACRAYGGKGDIDPNDPRYPAWINSPSFTVTNVGALIYFTGSMLGNFTANQPCIHSKVQISNEKGYYDCYGKTFLNGTHIETSYLLYCKEHVFTDTTKIDRNTVMLQVSGCHGYMANTSDAFIITGDSRQMVSIKNCGFYGEARTKPIIYSLYSPCDIDYSCFTNVGNASGLFRYVIPKNKRDFLFLHRTNSNQTVEGFSESVLRCNQFGDGDVAPSMVDINWYDNNSGEFIAKTTLKNLKVIFQLNHTGSYNLDVILKIDGAVVNTFSFLNTQARGEFFIGYVPSGSRVSVSIKNNSGSHVTLSGNNLNRLLFIGSC